MRIVMQQLGFQKHQQEEMDRASRSNRQVAMDCLVGGGGNWPRSLAHNWMAWTDGSALPRFQRKELGVPLK